MQRRKERTKSDFIVIEWKGGISSMTAELLFLQAMNFGLMTDEFVQVYIDGCYLQQTNENLRLEHCHKFQPIIFSRVQPDLGVLRSVCIRGKITLFLRNLLMPDGTPEKCSKNVKQFIGDEFNLHSAKPTINILPILHVNSKTKRAAFPNSLTY